MDEDVLRKTLEEAREMRAYFYEQTNGLRQPLTFNTEKFARIIGEKLGYTITSRLSSKLGKHLKGLLIRYDERKEAVILISDSINECWKRFTYIKEVCHLFLDSKGDFIIDSEALVLALIEEQSLQNPMYASETAAAFAAIEIMIPEYLKGWMEHKANVDNQTPYQIAHALKVPQKYVEYQMRKWNIDP